MKNTIVLLFILFISLQNSFAQTDSLVIYKYNSLKEWEGNLKTKTSFIDNHFKGGYDKFHTLLSRNLGVDVYLKEICSTGILLFSLVFEKDTVTLNFSNKYLHSEQESLATILRNIDSLWTNLPKEKCSFNFSIGNTFHLHDGILKGDTGTTFETHTYFEVLIGEASICDCLFKSNRSIEAQFNKAIFHKDYEVATMLSKELMRRQPFNKDLYEKYKKVQEKSGPLLKSR